MTVSKLKTTIRDSLDLQSGARKDTGEDDFLWYRSSKSPKERYWLPQGSVASLKYHSHTYKDEYKKIKEAVDCSGNNQNVIGV